MISHDLLSNPFHNFNKKNLVGQIDSLGVYDLYVCSKCGMKGKRRNFGNALDLSNKYSDEKIKFCMEGHPTTDEYVGTLIKVRFCDANGPAFATMKPGSLHAVITPPDDYINGDRGVWVMGVGEPVKLLNAEFIQFTLKRRK